MMRDPDGDLPPGHLGLGSRRFGGAGAVFSHLHHDFGGVAVDCCPRRWHCHHRYADRLHFSSPIVKPSCPESKAQNNDRSRERTAR